MRLSSAEFKAKLTKHNLDRGFPFNDESFGFRVEPYTHTMRAWLGKTDHYLANPPAGAMFAVTVRKLVQAAPSGDLLGAVVVGRPISPKLSQDGTLAQITRMWLHPALPFGVASAILRLTMVAAYLRGCAAMITYHDRTRHTGCAYKKAGFRKDGVTNPGALGWGSREGRASAGAVPTPKRRWRVDLVSRMEG